MNEERIQYPLIVQAVSMVNTRISADPNIADQQLDLLDGAFTKLCQLMTRPISAATEANAKPQQHQPAVPIDQSVTPDHIVCLEDGKRFKSMKRHLAALGMTPREYRAKWGLRGDYPMTAPAYAAARSAISKQYHLGIGGKKPRALTASQKAAMTTPAEPIKRKIGRPRKTPAPIVTGKAKNGRAQHVHG